MKKIRKHIRKVLLEELSKKKCTNFFDINSINSYVEFDKPLYSIVAKRKTAKLVYMSPRQYIYTIAQGFGGLSYEDAIAYANLDDERLVKKYAEDMKRGDKFPVGYYTRDGEMQEGRHRALAAMSLGCENMPVVEFIKLNDQGFQRVVNKFRDMEFSELNELFIGMGFENGITKLGYHELKRYVEYNLSEINIKNKFRKLIYEKINKSEIIFGHSYNNLLDNIENAELMFSEPDEVLDGLIKVLQKIQRKNNIELYRVVFAKKEDEININQLGHHYVLDIEDFHEEMIDYLYINAKKENSELNESDLFVVKIKTPASNVDFSETILTNSLHPNESEITILNDKNIKIINIDTYYEDGNSLMESKFVKGKKIIPRKFIYHVSNINFRDSINKKGLETSVGACYLSYSEDQDIKEKDCYPAIFASNSKFGGDLFDDDLDNDIWQIDTTKIPNYWYVDNHYSGLKFNLNIVTFEDISRGALKLIYKGTYKDVNDLTDKEIEKYWNIRKKENKLD